MASFCNASWRAFWKLNDGKKRNGSRHTYMAVLQYGNECELSDDHSGWSPYHTHNTWKVFRPCAFSGAVALRTLFQLNMDIDDRWRNCCLNPRNILNSERKWQGNNLQWQDDQLHCNLARITFHFFSRWNPFFSCFWSQFFKIKLRGGLTLTHLSSPFPSLTFHNGYTPPIFQVFLESFENIHTTAFLYNTLKDAYWSWTYQNKHKDSACTQMVSRCYDNECELRNCSEW